MQEELCTANNEEQGHTIRRTLSYDDGQLYSYVQESFYGFNPDNVQTTERHYVYDDDGRLEGTVDDEGNLTTRYIYDD